MQKSTQVEQEDKICWIINLERKSLKLQLLEYKKYSSFTFIDPLKNIFGFIISRNDNKPKEKSSKDTKTHYQRFKQTEKKITIDSPISQSSHMNSEFYKNYLQARNKSKQSKRDSFNSNYMNMSLDINEHPQKKMSVSMRPITTRINTPNHNPYTNKKEQMNSSMEISKTITLGHHSDVKTNISNRINNTTPISSYEPVSQNSLRQPKESYYPQHFTNSAYRQIQTDRKIQYGIKDVRASLGYSNGNVNQKQHQKFYKRVKQIKK